MGVGPKSVIALNRYAVGSRPADREGARARDYETRLLSTAFSMSALPLIATTERTCQHVSNVPQAVILRTLHPLCCGVPRVNGSLPRTAFLGASTDSRVLLMLVNISPIFFRIESSFWKC